MIETATAKIAEPEEIHSVYVHPESIEEIANTVVNKLSDKLSVVSPQWTPCSAGLPKKDGEYFVTIGTPAGWKTDVLWFNTRDARWSSQIEVIAWMPRSESYRYRGGDE